MTKRTIATLSAFAAAAFIGSSAYAGTPVKATDSKTTKEVVKESCITGDLGVDFTSNYISRGVPQENQGVIAQPYTDLYFKIYEGSGALTKATINLSAWSSVHDHKAVSTPTTSSWFEFDYAAGITLQFGKLSITPSFIAILSPNNAFADNYNANINISYDDSDLLGAFALHPHVTVLFELEGKAGTGAEEGIYYEVGIAPSFQAGPATISLPINVGLGSNGFYGNPVTGTGDDTFGFFSAGVAAELPLHFLPECLGQWALKANATYYKLGDNTSIVNNATGGNETQWSFGGGVVVRF